MSINEDAFLERYNKLNEQQQHAVNTIYGPVMVIAGPGTGKTEVLSMRIANLLRSDAQVQPNEILCLTYTDEATNSMRRRLLQIIGSDAHRVNICTFHAFCNNVIQNNSEYFSIRSLQPITDLERSTLIRDIINNLPKGHELRKLSGNIYSDTSRLNNLFDMMKRENISSEDLQNAVDTYIESLPERDEYIYKRNGKGFKKGELKQANIDAEVKKVSSTKAAAALFDVYQEKMAEHGWYDFNDMILWVLKAFKENEALLQDYQERHQFILVDEFQDTNGAQNELLKLLSDFWDSPNIFTVGDDDQSIYEFQGARIKNITEFYERYKDNIELVILDKNYRSSQNILNSAMATIENNKQRLITQLDDLRLDKNIKADHDRFAESHNNIDPVIKEYHNVVHEEADVISQIEALQKEGVALNEVAILYAQHKQADNIIALLERKNIPYAVKKPVNILDLPLVEHIINLLQYLVDEQKAPFSGEAVLFSLLHTSCYGINPIDIASLSLYMQQNKSKDDSLRNWRMLLSNGLLLSGLNLSSTAALQRMGNNLNSWLTQLNELPLPMLIEKLLYESGMVQYLSKTKNYTWDIQVLHTFFDFVKELHGRNQRLKAADLLQTIEQMQAEGISLPIQKVVHAEKGVHLFTAHGAKGNEFEYVFLVGCTKNFWEAKRGGNYEFKLPDTITNTETDNDKTYKIEVARRLFFVSVTRAKKFLHVSYAAKDGNGKALEHTQFIDEISSDADRQEVSLTEEQVTEHIRWAMTPEPEIRIKLANHEWIEHQLKQLIMSPTTLSKYLNCPISFYYERILKVPFQKNDALAFGSAVHNSLERMFGEMKKNNGTFPSLEEVLGYFDMYLRREIACFTKEQYDRRQEQGHNILTDYYETNINDFVTNVEIEFSIPRYLLDGVPVTGKIDKIEFTEDGCTVIDYKTGNPDTSVSKYTVAPNDANKLGGDYWRQMVFYKILIDNFKDRNWNVTKGVFHYVQRSEKNNEFKKVEIPFFSKDEEEVKKQLKESYAKIMNHQFDTGCSEETCYWCNFTKKYGLVRQEEPEMDD